MRNHVQQRDDGRAKSLRMAGIMSSYHNRSLTTVRGAETLVNWLSTTAREDIQHGRGVLIVGPGIGAYDAAVLATRSLHMTGLGSRLLTVGELNVYIAKDDEDELGSIDEKPVLTVMNFVQRYGDLGSPFTSREVKNIEDYLTRRLNDRRSVIFHMSDRDPPVWWSRAFLSRITDLSEQHVVLS